MTSFYISKLLVNQSVYFPTVLVVNNVEIRPCKSDLPEEKKALSQSIKSNEESINLDVNCKLGTIVKAKNEAEAILFADEQFVKTLDILSVEFPLSELKIATSGYVKNLDSGQIEPIHNKNLKPNMTFLRRTGNFEKIRSCQWIAILDNELADRYRRSLYWSRICKFEKNIQIKILFRWFAVEALFKKTETDNVGPIIRWFLGYPNGEKAQYVSEVLIRKLQSKPEYLYLKDRIKDSVEAIRVFRNNSIHNGFRTVDFSTADIKFYNQIMTYGCSRCQGAVYAALAQKITTVDEFKEYIWIVFSENRNLINDVHGNILFSLSTQSYTSYENDIYQ